MKKNLLMCIMALTALSIHAQETSGTENRWYVGIGGGIHYGTMKFSDLNSEQFPTNKGTVGPVYSVFVQGEFGTEHQFVIRPQVSYLTRGGKLTEIGKFNGYSDFSIDDVFYHVKAHYVDFRLPLLYQFGSKDSGIRPYIGVTPIVGFPVNGNIRLQEDNKDMSYAGYKVDLNKSNISSTYFAVAPTVGVRFNFHTGKNAQNLIFVGIEANYQIGITDTYGSDEKDGKALDVVNGAKYKLNGTRKFSGLEVQATLGIPFSAFKRAKTTEISTTYKEPVVTKEVEITVEEKPCYTLEEIEDLMVRNESVYGKTICAVDAINFDFGKSSIKKESFTYLNRLANTLQRTNSKVIVKGHTDNVGNNEFNMELSKKRAEAVVNYLVKQGLSRNKLLYEYYGASRPISDNDTDEGRTYNRRVEFEIVK